MSSRVVHLHPSRRCNLACLHCYSSSGPDVRGELSPRAVLRALKILREEGYEVLSLSGGEPLLYGGLEALLRGASQLGYRVNMVTNGAALGGKLLDMVATYVSIVAVSLDGDENTHNRLRGDKRAFGWVEQAVDRLSTAGVGYGLSYCVSKDSLRSMPWAAEFAANKGARMLQFHLFGAVGRGSLVASRLGLSSSDKARAFVTSKLLKKSEGLAIHLDLVPASAALARRSDYRVWSDPSPHTRLADLVNPLVIDETGRIMPFSYGIDQDYTIGRLVSEFEQSVTQFKTTGVRKVQELLHRTFAQLETQDLVDWFQLLVETSWQLGTRTKRQHIPATSQNIEVQEGT